MNTTEQATAAGVSSPISREALVDLIAEGLRGTYHCGRVWEAWSVGTMSEGDFSPVDESDTPGEIADAVLALLAAALAADAVASPVLLLAQIIQRGTFTSEGWPIGWNFQGPCPDGVKAGLMLHIDGRVDVMDVPNKELTGERCAAMVPWLQKQLEGARAETLAARVELKALKKEVSPADAVASVAVGEREKFEQWAISAEHAHRARVGVWWHDGFSEWSAWQVWKHFAAQPQQATLPASTARCDGNHGGPRCNDPSCWNDDTPLETGEGDAR